MPISSLAPALAALLAFTVPQPGLPAKGGKLATGSCPEQALTDGGIPRSRQYLGAVVRCLNTSWRAYFRKAGLRFSPPAVRYAGDPHGTACGVPLDDVDALYCHPTRTLVFTLTGRWIDGRTDLYPFKVAAHEYAHHVQTLTGVRRSYEARHRAEPARRAELRRRFELQADCLAGVFIGSVYGSLARTGEDWQALKDAVRATGDEDGGSSHGTGAGRVSWLERGKRTLDPSACDTWSAPARKVS
ncbi:neutral zinc metallopeptidase [Nonomuraea sp. NPDC049309]|uniref:neutral zinc metallopeptidase n=1 Tax=Nonomuraea sp. NPDC049309 TaxID=3364350 RepID=UPI0037216ADF